MAWVNSRFHAYWWFACWHFIAIENNVNNNTFFLVNFIFEEWGYEMSANATALIYYDAYSLSDMSWVQFRSS